MKTTRVLAVAALLALPSPALAAAESTRPPSPALATVAGSTRPPSPAQAAAEPARPAAGGVVYVTNALSRDVASLAIGPGAALTPLGKPVATGGEFPRGIALTPDGTTAYVVNSDSDTLAVFRVGARGALRPGPRLVKTGDEPWGATVSPDGRTLYVTNTADATISAYRIGPGGMPADRRDFPATSDHPKQTVLTPDGRFLYLSYADTDETPASPPRVVTVFRVRPDGSLGPGRDVAKTGPANYAIALSGAFVYVASAEAGNVWGFRRGADGSLTPVPGSPFPAPDLPVGLKVTPDGRHLYAGSNDPATGSPPGGLLGFTILANGSLRPTAGSPAPTPGRAIVESIAITPDGGKVFAAIRDTSEVVAFTIKAGGALKEAPGSPFPTGGQRPLNQSIAVLPVAPR